MGVGDAAVDRRIGSVFVSVNIALERNMFDTITNRKNARRLTNDRRGESNQGKIVIRGRLDIDGVYRVSTRRNAPANTASGCVSRSTGRIGMRSTIGNAKVSWIRGHGIDADVAQR